MNASYAYNNAIDVWDSPDAYEDPTCTVSTCWRNRIAAGQITHRNRPAAASTTCSRTPSGWSS